MHSNLIYYYYYYVLSVLRSLIGLSEAINTTNIRTDGDAGISKQGHCSL